MNEVSGRLKSHFPGARYRADECAQIVSPRDTSVYIQPCDEDDGEDNCAANSCPFLIINDVIDVGVDIDVNSRV